MYTMYDPIYLYGVLVRDVIGKGPVEREDGEDISRLALVKSELRAV